jgi:D-cysteine desulfhydrase family pyridoxal phosphate-dependent enzyme
MKKYDLGFFPTPLHKLKNLSEKYSGFNIFIKRDDCTGLLSGGNKTRKLEYLLQDAIDKGCNSVITAGAQQSNHCRQTAAACAQAKLKCFLLLGGNKPDQYDGNLLLSKIMGAEIYFTGDKRKGEDIEILATELRSKGLNPYIIPYGGSNIIGAKGFIEAAKELSEQMADYKLGIDYIFFASSSGGTQAGLTLGKLIYNLEARLMPVCIDKDEVNGLKLDQAVLNLANEGKLLYNLDCSLDLDDVKLIEDYNEAGYGVVTNNEKDAITELAVSEGILLDPVYTGRAFYAMMDHLRKGLLKPGSNVLFWHTGGFPSTFYYAEKLQ